MLKKITLFFTMLLGINPYINAADVELVPFTREKFNSFCESFLFDYAQDLVNSGLCSSKEQASEKARYSLDQSFPNGFDSEGYYLYEIVGDEEVVGVLWYSVPDISHQLQDGAWLCNIEIDSEFQRRGYARAAMLKMEEHLKEEGVKRIGLSVFAYNIFAKKLYESLGYEVFETRKAVQKDEITHYLLKKEI